mmetsp:Transcript_6317/g.15358  ORF Transcript_6317/g.15358 Transcript_6317/m.15358 type:complete len:229 (-) Transcript_6317:196-882(-)
MALSVHARRVVESPLAGVLEHSVGLDEELELFRGLLLQLGGGVFVHVRVKHARLLAEGHFNLVHRCAALLPFQAQNLVVPLRVLRREEVCLAELLEAELHPAHFPCPPPRLKPLPNPLLLPIEFLFRPRDAQLDGRKKLATDRRHVRALLPLIPRRCQALVRIHETSARTRLGQMARPWLRLRCCSRRGAKTAGKERRQRGRARPRPTAARDPPRHGTSRRKPAGWGP